MNKTIKWISLILGGLIAVVVLAVILVPVFFDAQRLKPFIEERVEKATNRPFSMGKEIELSLFPWVGVSLADVHLGNPPGFGQKDFFSAESFDVKVRLFPLFKKDIQIKRLALNHPTIVMEVNEDGMGNWEQIGKTAKETHSPMKDQKEKSPEPETTGQLPFANLAVGEVAVTNGYLLFVDRMNGERKEISGIELRIKDISLERAIQIALSGELDDLPFSIKGSVGPVGKNPVKGTIPLDVTIGALNQIDLGIKGQVSDLTDRQQIDLMVRVEPFSPRKLMAALGRDFPVETADPRAIDHVSLTAKLNRDPDNISISEGAFELDESKVGFSIKIKNDATPHIDFNLEADQINIDRFLPPGEQKSPGPEKKEQPVSKTKNKADYSLFRRPLVNGSIHLGTLYAAGATVQDVGITIRGKDGLFIIDPFLLKLYEGKISSRITVDVRRDLPRSHIELDADGIQSNRMVRDLFKRDIIEGRMKAKLDIHMEGDEVEGIRKTLNGEGIFSFSDGAVVGLDLGGILRNYKSIIGLEKKKKERLRTDFSEMKMPFKLKNGIFKTDDTSLVSPLLRANITGTADLVKEVLDFRIEPTLVATLKGQGDKKERQGATFPVFLKGKFKNPKIRVDIEGFEKGIEDLVGEDGILKKVLSKEKSETGEDKEDAEDALKGLLKDFILKE